MNDSIRFFNFFSSGNGQPAGFNTNPYGNWQPYNTGNPFPNVSPGQLFDAVTQQSMIARIASLIQVFGPSNMMNFATHLICHNPVIMVGIAGLVLASRLECVRNVLTSIRGTYIAPAVRSFASFYRSAIKLKFLSCVLTTTVMLLLKQLFNSSCNPALSYISWMIDSIAFPAAKHVISDGLLFILCDALLSITDNREQMPQDHDLQQPAPAPVCDNVPMAQAPAGMVPSAA
jgi:hypothetical protein